MKNIKIKILSLFLFIGLFAKADEGMWFLMFIDRLNHRDMQKMGLQLSAEEIYSINNSSLKDAIVQFNGGCTAELISDQGLLLTNHHCGYGSIAELSTPEDNILKNGFWAKNKAQERKPKSLFVRFFVRMDDVSKRILSLVNDNMTEKEREEVITKEIKLIKEENSENGKYVVSVKSFFKGNEFYYFVYQDYSDVRLVGTPPESIGKFGGDTDNWEWPRHTGDFSMFRVYGDKDGNPAKYSEDNIPINPKKHLSINISGVKQNDFAMILGYPGRTNRWLPAGGINQNVKYAYPAWVEASENAMNVIKKYSENDNETRINYASNYARIANYWKNRKGMIEALIEHKTIDKKQKTESEFTEWSLKKKKKRYKNIVKNINDYYVSTNDKSALNNYLSITLRFSNFAYLPYKLSPYIKKFKLLDDSPEKDKLLTQIKELLKKHYTKLNPNLESELLYEQLHLLLDSKTISKVFKEKSDEENETISINEFLSKSGLIGPETLKVESNIDNNNGSDSKSNTLIISNNESSEEQTKSPSPVDNKSIFFDTISLMAYLKDPISDSEDGNGDLKTLYNDPLYKISTLLVDMLKFESEKSSKLKEGYKKSYRLLVEGLRESKISNIKYPDANSTLRLSYGKVSPLPADKRNDANINYYTTLKGTIAKYKPNDLEFDLPAKLQDLYKQKNYGDYADKNGYLPVNFLTNNDITGGNSGSPVLNGNGELIGLAFDGNIEAMAGDVIFDKKLQKTINVDIRYVLFLIDKYAGAKNIIEELSIIK
ncbi:MAG: S46 family peptidase [Crocinitomicaceae bacterium]|nr:S46 family peptidase [Crocinitomicaceae bacterium]